MTGFRTGHDSVLLGSTPTVAMPQDERTAALLLLVTSTFVHLSASQAEPMPLIRGAIDADGGAYRFVTLDPSCTKRTCERFASRAARLPKARAAPSQVERDVVTQVAVVGSAVAASTRK